MGIATVRSNNDLQQSRRSASAVSGAGCGYRRDQRKRELAGRAAEIKLVRTNRLSVDTGGVQPDNEF